MTGKLQTKSISKALVLKSNWIKVLEIIFAFGLGILAITLHAHLRLPLNIPGRHGLEFMALVVVSRSFTRFPFSGTLFSLGVGAMLVFPVLGFKNPLSPMLYMLPGIVYDLLWYSIPRLKNNVIVTGIIGGFSYSIVAIVKVFLALTTGFYYKAMLPGPWYPILSFFAFGLAGAIITKGIIQSFKKNP